MARWYKLKINNTYGVPLFTSELSDNNRGALAIQFNINAYSDVSQSTPSTLTIFNPPKAMLTSPNMFKNARILLEAGIGGSALLNKIANFVVGSSTIYSGIIMNSVVNYAGRETSVTLFMGAITSISVKRDGKEATLNLVKGQPIITQVQSQILLPALKSDYIITASNEVLTNMDYFAQTDTKITKKFSTLQDVFDWLRNEVKIVKKGVISDVGIVASLQNNTIHFSSANESSLLSKVPKTIQTREILSQPQFVNMEQLALEVVLNGSYKLGMSLEWDARIAIAGTSSSVANVADIATDKNSISVIADIKGADVIQVTHNGDSRNTAASAWATNLLLVRKKGSSII